MLDLYRNIRSRRIELGLSQQQLADKLGYTDRSSIAKVEAGLIDLSESKITKFAEALHISASELMGFQEADAPAAAASAANISNQTIEKFSPLLEQLSSDDLDKVYELANLLLLSEKYRGTNGSPDK